MKTNFGLVILMVCGQISLAQVNDFQFKRKISATDSAGWYSMSLPPDIFRSLKKDFSDLRIYQINGSDTSEAPYLLKIHQQEMTAEVFHPATFNQVTKDGFQFFTFETPRHSQVNFIDLTFNETNFDGYASIDGSDNQKDWFEISKHQRVIAIVNQNINFYSGAIHFSVQHFRYLRVKVKTDKMLTLKEVTLKHETIQPAREARVDLSWKARVEKKAKQTVINVDLNNYQPVIKLAMELDEKVDYYRAFRLEQITDSTSTPKGWQYFYSTVAQGFLTSLDSNRFTFDYTLAKKMRVVVEDGDNVPLNFKSITMFGPQVELITRLTRGDHYLYYGSLQTGIPNYDVVNFQNKIPQHVPSLRLGDQERLKGAAMNPVWALNKVWMWVLMGIVMAVLAFFTVRMMKEK